MSELLIFIFSLIFGSFANNVVSYYVQDSKFDICRSKCFCKLRKLNLSELIPIFSFIKQNGKCSYCKIELPKRYPLIEILFGAIGLLTYYQFGLNYVFIINLFTFFLLIIVASIDLEVYRVPNLIVLSLFIIFIIKAIGFHKLYLSNVLISLLLLLIFMLTNTITLKTINKEVIGYGDIKLISTLVLFQNTGASLLTLWTAAFLAIPGFYLMKLFSFKNHQEKKIPFGFFLSISFIIVKFSEKHIVNYFNSIFART